MAKCLACFLEREGAEIISVSLQEDKPTWLNNFRPLYDWEADKHSFTIDTEMDKWKLRVV